ncbi:MAG: CoA transferase, partial [Alphaproteobacteria bacterium]
LARDADVVVENYRPDVKHRLGIDYDSLAALNPRLVYASISGFGQDGPYAGRPGVDQVAQGMGGIMSITGKPGDGPMRVGVPLADLTAGLLCATGILIALLERESSGRGQWVQTSLIEAQIQLLDLQAVRWLMDGVVASQSGNDHPTSMPTGLYETKDGHINIGGSGGGIFARFAEVIGMADLATRPEFSSEALRSRNRVALNAVIAPRIRQRTSAEWIEGLNAAGVPAGPVNDMRQVFEDPQVRHQGMVAEVDHPTLGHQRLLGQAISMSRTPWRVRRATPERGEHTDEILAGLGYDGDDRDRLRRDGAI